MPCHAAGAIALAHGTNGCEARPRACLRMRQHASRVRAGPTAPAPGAKLATCYGSGRFSLHRRSYSGDGARHVVNPAGSTGGSPYRRGVPPCSTAATSAAAASRSSLIVPDRTPGVRRDERLPVARMHAVPAAHMHRDLGVTIRKGCELVPRRSMRAGMSRLAGRRRLCKGMGSSCGAAQRYTHTPASGGRVVVPAAADPSIPCLHACMHSEAHLHGPPAAPAAPPPTPRGQRPVATAGAARPRPRAA